MKTDIYVNFSPHEKRIAVCEDDKLVEFHVERSNRERTVGNIYKGKVMSVLAGMDVAFVDIGLARTAFLPLSEISHLPEKESAGEEKPHPKSRPHIQDLLREGQEIIVQVTKEPIGTKGARITTQLSLAGRFLVMIPHSHFIGISKKLTDWNLRKDLKKMILDLRPADVGIIVRTLGAHQSEREFSIEIKTLSKTWDRISYLAQKTSKPCLLYKDMNVVSGVIRDIFSEDINQLVFDSKIEYRSMVSYIKNLSPHLKNKIVYYQENEPIFDYYRIETEIDKMMKKKVWLKSGGYLFFEQTEALVAIDINTGKFVGRSNYAKTILQTNLEAAREIARQIRLRDLSGLIVIDFIDMDHPDHRHQVFRELGFALDHDRANTSALPMSRFGLVEMTRQRTGISLLNTLFDECPRCHGSGKVISKWTLLSQIERWLKRIRANINEKSVQLKVHPEMTQFLNENKAERLYQLKKSSALYINLVSAESMEVEECRIYSADGTKDLTEVLNRTHADSV